MAMAEKALAIDNYLNRDYWIGGVRAENGTWEWQSGSPMEYTNWCYGCLAFDDHDHDCSQLLKEGYPGILDTFYWAQEFCPTGGENGAICEMNVDK